MISMKILLKIVIIILKILIIIIKNDICDMLNEYIELNMTDNDEIMNDNTD